MKNVPFNFEDYDNDETRELLVDEEMAQGLDALTLVDVFDQTSNAHLDKLFAAIACDDACAAGRELMAIARRYIKDNIDDDELEDFARAVHRDLCEAPDDLQPTEGRS